MMEVPDRSRRPRVAAALGMGLALLCVASCSVVGLPNVATTVSGAPASPPVLASREGAPAVTSRADWEAHGAPGLRSAFQSLVYGQLPAPQPVNVVDRTQLAPDIEHLGTAEQWIVQIGDAGQDLSFAMVLLLPRSDQPVPVILMQNFCGNALSLRGVAGVNPPRRGTPPECGNSLMLPLVPVIFGGAIMTPPLDAILAAGYGVAMVYAGDVVPDDPELAEPVLAALTPPGTAPAERTGAIAGWAWTYQRTLDALAGDPRVASDRMILWGHSRNGKAALLAAAMDPRPAAVIALQAGTAGASLGRDAVGESIDQITQAFPHWFAPAYASWASRQSALPVDQHQLLALIAPRPVLLGSARRDRWSDPHGALRAAAGASPVYQLYGDQPFRQRDLRRPDFGPQLVTYMRPGLHGVHTEDWDQALAFLATKLPQTRSTSQAAR